MSVRGGYESLMSTNITRIDKEQYYFGGILLLANKLQVWGDGILPDLTFKQLFLLLFIKEMESNNPTVKEVSDFTGTSRQNVKKMLERLEMTGYVSLTRSKIDARAWGVALTEKSFEYFAEHDQKSAEIVSEMFSNISDEELDSAMQTMGKLFYFLDTAK